MCGSFSDFCLCLLWVCICLCLCPCPCPCPCPCDSPLHPLHCRWKKERKKRKARWKQPSQTPREHYVGKRDRNITHSFTKFSTKPPLISSSIFFLIMKQIRTLCPQQISRNIRFSDIVTLTIFCSLFRFLGNFFFYILSLSFVQISYGKCRL